MKPTLEFLIDLAYRAGEILRKGFGKPLKVEYKGEIDLVTDVDRQSESFLIQHIQDKFPSHTIVTEESGHLSGVDNHAWYIDPLDGTVNYAHGVPIFAVSLAYAFQGKMQLGVIFDPMQNECFSAELGKGTWLNDRPMRVSETSSLNKSLLVTGFPYDIRTAQMTNLQNYSYFAMRTQAVRRLGSAALDLAYVAAGRLDAYWEVSIHPWDIAAGTLMVHQAGGIVTDLQGGPEFFQPPYATIASAPGIHQQMVDGLNRSEP